MKQGERRPLSPRAQPRYPRRQGFTLLEVLAAVAILGIWYVVIATLAMQGLRAEGESRRILEASLIADEFIADLEVAIDTGQLPPLETSEEERKGFLIQTDVTPFDIPAPRAEGEPLPPTGPPSAFSHLTGANNQPPLRRILVEVSWIEGTESRKVTRETYALDLTGAMQKLIDAGATLQPGGSESEETDEEGSS